jgi:hypothetical protein
MTTLIFTDPNHPEFEIRVILEPGSNQIKIEIVKV